MKGKFFKIAVCNADKRESRNIVTYIECYYHDSVIPVKIKEFDKKEMMFDELINNGFDVIFDCFDGETGIEIARKVRDMSNTCKVVMITNSSKFAIEAHNLWVNYYVIKPVSYDYVCNALNRCQ